MNFAISIARKVTREVAALPDFSKATRIYSRYRDFTMMSAGPFVTNLLLCKHQAPPTGCVVEAGVWRGGMSAGIADMMPGRIHYLFDSFEGLPPAQPLDGEAAINWQRNSIEHGDLDNCRAERSFAEQAMRKSRAKEFHLVKGWFRDTVPSFVPSEPIAILRLDGDWYDSTMECLDGLYHHLMPGGILILDDYYHWDGCTRAVHDFLSKTKSVDRIDQWRNICYLVKRLA